MPAVNRFAISAALAVLTLLASAGPASARVPGSFFGMVWDRGVTRAPASDQEQQWALMQQSGVRTVRTVFRWAAVEPVAGGPLDWSSTDPLVGYAAANKIELLPVVLGAPGWAAVGPPAYGATPERVGDYAAFMRELVMRYGPAGTFWAENPQLPRRPLRTWQIWNEPHLDFYWNVLDRGRNAWVREYPRLLKAATPAIKAADPGATVVLAGLADFAWRHLTRLNRRGIRGSFDVAAINLFTSTPRRVLKGIRLFRRAMVRGGESRRPVWLTETTWPAARGRVAVPKTSWQRGWYTTDTGMARRLRSFYTLAARRRRALRLQRVYWYTWASAYGDGDLFDYSGLVKYTAAGVTERPALAAYARIARGN